MRVTLLLLVAIAMLALLLTRQENIEIAGEQDFEKEIQSDQPTTVMFYAPWCPHCNALKPRFLRRRRRRRFRVLNGDRNRRLVEKYNIRHYPTVVKFKNGKKVKVVENLETFE